jgi:hypothetical protein
MKSGTRALYIDKQAYPENRPYDSHTFLMSVNKFPPFFPQFLTDLGEMRQRRHPSNSAEQL